MSPPRFTDERQSLGDGVWRLMVALLQAWDVATDPEKQASPRWLTGVRDVTASLLMELNIAGGDAANDRIQELDAVPPRVPAQPPQARGLGQAIDAAVASLEELAVQRDVTWIKRAGGSEGSAEALMADTVRILGRCMELHPTSSPSSHLKAKVCAAVLRVVRRCTVAVEFRRPIQALQSGVFEIKMGTTDGNSRNICVRLDAVWPAPSDLGNTCFGPQILQKLACGDGHDPGSYHALERISGDVLYHCRGLGNIKLGTDAMEARLINKKYLTTLTLEWSDNSIYLDEDDEENSVKGLPALKNLEISHCSNLVSVVGLSKLSSVEKLKIVKCPRLDGCYGYLSPVEEFNPQPSELGIWLDVLWLSHCATSADVEEGHYPSRLPFGRREEGRRSRKAAAGRRRRCTTASRLERGDYAPGP
nr:unnamed protein product [Digitaria exilis]